ncbi:MAG: hypothetical protein NXI19_15495 [Alphaproteobacteria bacterium]|nr:hypothetical protein [Alphaproteobacteria bacterium]
MAIGPTNATPLAPLSGGDRGRVATVQGREVTTGRPQGSREGVDAEARQSRVLAARTLGQGEDGRAELADDDSFQQIVDQATDRARQSNPNAPRGSFVDILV